MAGKIRCHNCTNDCLRVSAYGTCLHGDGVCRRCACQVACAYAACVCSVWQHVHVVLYVLVLQVNHLAFVNMCIAELTKREEAMAAERKASDEVSWQHQHAHLAWTNRGLSYAYRYAHVAYACGLCVCVCVCVLAPYDVLASCMCVCVCVLAAHRAVQRSWCWQAGHIRVLHKHGHLHQVPEHTHSRAGDQGEGGEALTHTHTYVCPSHTFHCICAVAKRLHAC